MKIKGILITGGISFGLVWGLLGVVSGFEDLLLITKASALLTGLAAFMGFVGSRMEPSVERE